MLLMPFAGMMGAAVDYGRALHAQTEIQAVIDGAAVAGARLPATVSASRQLAAGKFFAAGLELTNLTGVAADIHSSNAEVKIDAWYSQETIVLSLLGIDEIGVEVSSTARAQVDNGGVACVLALSPDSADGLHLQGINQAAADNCWVWVNSSSGSAINAVGAAEATAQGFCTAGLATGAEHFGPSPYTGCAPMADPFAEKFESDHPLPAPCTKSNLQLKSGTYTLSPGVYCGNTVLKPHAHVTFLPGNYVFQDGYLEIQGQASVTGAGVTMIFTGADARMIVRGGGEIDVTAPAEGDYAGFVLVKRAAGHGIQETVIQGGGRVRIVGVIYAPEWRVNIGGNGEINQESEFFAMVADHFYMEGNGRLWVNSDFDAAGMPGIMPRIKSGPVLTR